MKKYPLSRIHYGFSVNISNREKTYLEADKDTKMFYVPELAIVEVVTKKKGVTEVIWTSAYNIKYMLPIMEETLADTGSSQKNSKGSKEAPAQANA